MLLMFDPFMLFRALLSVVYGAIWVYTVVESVTMILAMISRSKDEGKAKIEARKTLEEVGAIRGRIPKTVIIRLRESRRKLSNERLIRVAKKAGSLKLMQFISLRTLKVVWRELAYIGVLVVAIYFTLSYYYAMVL